MLDAEAGMVTTGEISGGGMLTSPKSISEAAVSDIESGGGVVKSLSR